MELLTWEDVHRSELTEPEFLVDPYLLREGITLLWGKYSTGKSPLTWELARAVGTGTHFFGLPAKEGRVLYIEIDLPKNGAVPRLKHLGDPPPNVWFAFSQPLSLGLGGFPPEQTSQLKELNETISPDLVIFDSLRKIHDLDDKDSRAPKLVYGVTKSIFPHAALLFIHHERKSSQDPRFQYIGGEAFSGNQHWIDDAQSGLQMERYGSRRETFRLWHRKSQVSALLRPMGLSWDGKMLRSPIYEDLLCAYELLAQGESGAAVDHKVAELRGIGQTAARERRLLIEAGKFPGSRGFLERAVGEDEEE